MGPPALSFSARRKRQWRDLIISGFLSSTDTFLSFSVESLGCLVIAPWYLALRFMLMGPASFSLSVHDQETPLYISMFSLTISPIFHPLYGHTTAEAPFDS